ncbi:OmpA family protein [Spirosoma arcticum]
MRLHVLLLLIVGLCHAVTGQDKILTKDDVSISCRIITATSQQIHYVNTFNSQRDSIPTEKVGELRYADSTQLIVPALKRNQVMSVLPDELTKAIRENDYGTVLHAKATRLDFAFMPGLVALTTDGRRQALALAALLKTKPTFHTTLTVHTDTLGKAAANKTLSDRRAVALRSLLIANGVKGSHLTVIGMGESTPISVRQVLNRRVDVQVTAIDEISVLYAEPYVPPRQPEKVVPRAAEPMSTPVATQYIAPKKSKIGFVVYGEALYALEPLAKTWVNPDNGIGIQQGFGGGVLLNYYLTPRFGLTLQGGYGQWQVQRRYMTEEGEVIFTNDRNLRRILGQVGFRFYALRSVYLQPMGGGQLLTLASENSDTHPDGVAKAETKKFMPTFGGALGFEVGKGSFIVDVAAQYQMTPNSSDFAGATGPLHYVGLRAGIGFRPRAR